MEDGVVDWESPSETIGDAASGYTVTNSHTPEVLDIQVTKVWNDKDDQYKGRPGSVKVQLLADGAASGDVVELDKASNWKHTWTGLPAKAEGKAISYTVEETEVPVGYTVEVSGSAAAGFTVTNTYGSKLTDIRVTKVWDDDDNKDKLRTAYVRVQLYADGEVQGNVVSLNEKNGWTYTWKDLPATKAGTAAEIVYTVKETNVPDGYTMKQTGNAAEGFTITNTHTPTRRGGYGGGSSTPHWPGFATETEQPQGVLGVLRDPISQILGNYDQGVLGASRTGDMSAPALAGITLLMAFLGMAWLVIGRRREGER